jgi:hypothetical protein
MLDGRVLLSGGIYYCDPEFGFCSTTPAAEIYNYKTNSWQKVYPMITPRDGHASVLLNTGRVLAAGGTNDQVLFPLASAELFREF